MYVSHATCNAVPFTEDLPTVSAVCDSSSSALVINEELNEAAYLVLVSGSQYAAPF